MKRKTPYSRANRNKCPVMVGFQKTGATKIIYCGRWNCPHCAKKLARKWAYRTRLHIDAQQDPATSLTGQAQPYYFITLTLGSKYKDVLQGYRALPSLWESLRKAMEYAHVRWTYIAFVEGQTKTRGGMPHFHIICDKPLPNTEKNGRIVKSRVKTWAVRHGFGHQATQTVVDSHKAASYVAKYASKGDPETPKSFRRVRASRTWLKLSIDPDKKLLVQSADETTAQFLLRVSDATNVDPETLADRLFLAKIELRERQDRGNEPRNFTTVEA